MQRVFADTLLFCALFLLPFWAVFGIAAIAFFYFRDYYELLSVGLLLDVWYGAPLPNLGEFRFVLSLDAFVLFLLLTAFKARMRMRSR